MAGPQFPLSNTLFCRIDARLVVSVHGHSVAVAAEFAIGARADGSSYHVSNCVARLKERAISPAATVTTTNGTALLEGEQLLGSE